MLYQRVTRLSFPTTGAGLHDITREVVLWAEGHGMIAGLLTLYLPHSSASLLIQENADPAVRADLEDYFGRLVPEGPFYRHADEGPDDMPAHIRTALTATQLAIPLLGRRLALGIWQGIYLFEHRHHPRNRELVLHLLGE